MLDCMDGIRSVFSHDSVRNRRVTAAALITLPSSSASKSPLRKGSSHLFVKYFEYLDAPEMASPIPIPYHSTTICCDSYTTL
ncbi:unnamed protein product [Haemonchus placei]|uniref:Ovule protein n=1 Tax=Haemonchus placei TaxID=6290 RepID=A0A0N4W698_HAEPC|nr:unnamed protein product [Haemonchus placei]